MDLRRLSAEGLVDLLEILWEPLPVLTGDVQLEPLGLESGLSPKCALAPSRRFSAWVTLR
jgi:hypothetical protein